MSGPSGPWLPWAGAALLLALGVLLDTPWVRARFARRMRARLLGAYALARDRHALIPLAPFLDQLEESGVALAIGGALSALALLLFGQSLQGPGSSPNLRLFLVLPLYLGVLVTAASLLRLVLLAPRAFFLWLLRLALTAVEWVGRAAFGERAAVERRPFSYAAVLLVVAAGVGWGVVAGVNG